MARFHSRLHELSLASNCSASGVAHCSRVLCRIDMEPWLAPPPVGGVGFPEPPLGPNNQTADEMAQQEEQERLR